MLSAHVYHWQIVVHKMYVPPGSIEGKKLSSTQLKF